MANKALRLVKTFLIAIALVLPMATSAGPTYQLHEKCRAAIGKELPTEDAPPGWHYPRLESQVVWFAISAGGVVPVLAEGDFDGDKRPDIAYLIETNEEKKRFIAACLSSVKDVQFVGGLGCFEVIRTERLEKTSPQVIAAYCMDDKTSGYFQFRRGVFAFTPIGLDE